MPTGTLALIQTFTTIACPRAGCGVTFAINNEYRDRRFSDKKNFYCPNGHSMAYGENEADQLRKRTKALESDLAFEQGRLTTARNRLADERHSHAATKGQLTKTRKRAEHAMCPVQGCHRSFANVARHIANQHPGFVSTPKKP